MRRLSVGVIVVVCASIAPPGESAPSPCHREWPVLAHDARGRILHTARSRLPVACANVTGYATSESSIAVNNRGTVFYSPANTENTLARSRDRGATWSLVQPQQMEYTNYWNTVDPYLTVDKRTGRIFWSHATGPFRSTSGVVDDRGALFALAFAYGFQVYSTDDDGRHWTTADYRSAPMTDWEKVFVGPPSAAGPKPRGYPSVVYICANSPMEVIGPGRLCYRSLDGGATFDIAGFVFPSPSTPDACGVLNTNEPAVARDGTFYVPITCSGGSYLAVSADEGVSYNWIQVPGVPGGPNGPFPGNIGFQVALDAADNLYVSWVTNGKLYLTTSATRGRTWRRPASIGGPGLRDLSLPAIAAGPRAAAAVVYYASTRAGAGRLSAYATQTRDGGASFVTNALNDPRRPIFHDYGLFVSPRTDFVGAAYDRGGALWAGVVEQLSAADAANHVRTMGYVIHLV